MRITDLSEISALQAALARERERSRRLEAQLRNLADHDPLTDLPNRRSVEHELAQHLARCTRYGPEGALLLLGVDGLDTVTRVAGPRVADEALADLADRVVDRLRSTDVVGRWEDDQLAVLLARAGLAEVAVVAEALVGIVKETGTARVEPGSLRASIGAAFVAATPTGPELVDQAGEALAAARRRGGGWVIAGR